jgi:hypothetical protein
MGSLKSVDYLNVRRNTDEKWRRKSECKKGGVTKAWLTLKLIKIIFMICFLRVIFAFMVTESKSLA